MNLRAETARDISRAIQAHAFIATVTGTDGDNVIIQRPENDAADAQSWPKLDSYVTPVATDVVVVLDLGPLGRNECVVLGRIG